MQSIWTESLVKKWREHINKSCGPHNRSLDNFELADITSVYFHCSGIAQTKSGNIVALGKTRSHSLTTSRNPRAEPIPPKSLKGSKFFPKPKSGGPPAEGLSKNLQNARRRWSQRPPPSKIIDLDEWKRLTRQLGMREMIDGVSQFGDKGFVGGNDVEDNDEYWFGWERKLHLLHFGLLYGR